MRDIDLSPSKLWCHFHLQDNMPRGMKPSNFSWVVDDVLAASAFPRRVPNLFYLVENGITHLVSLTSQKPPLEHCPGHLFVYFIFYWNEKDTQCGNDCNIRLFFKITKINIFSFWDVADPTPIWMLFLAILTGGVIFWTGLHHVTLSISEFSPPSLKQMTDFVNLVEESRVKKEVWYLIVKYYR